MQGMKHTFPIRKFILFWLNRLHELEGQAVSKPETMALEAKFVGEAEGDNGCLVWTQASDDSSRSDQQEAGIWLNPWQ